MDKEAVSDFVDAAVDATDVKKPGAKARTLLRWAWALEVLSTVLAALVAFGS